MSARGLLVAVALGAMLSGVFGVTDGESRLAVGLAPVVVGPPPEVDLPTLFDANPTSGPVGSQIQVGSFTPCPKPATGGAWSNIVNFAQGSNSQVSYRNFPISAEGFWQGTFSIPVGAVPGAAQLTAACFNASSSPDPDAVTYTPVSFTVTPSAFTVSPASGNPGTVLAVKSADRCPPPTATGWSAIVKFGQGANPELGSKTFPVGTDGSWGGSLVVPVVPVVAVAGKAQLTAVCLDTNGAFKATVGYTPNDFDTTSPYEVRVTRSGAGAGKVTSSPAGIDCGATCKGSFGGELTLTVLAAAGSTFAAGAVIAQAPRQPAS